MPKLSLFSNASAAQVHTIILDMDPYFGDVTVDVIPKTRSLVMKAIEKSKRNRIYNRHKQWSEELGKDISVQGRPDDAFVQELADLLVQGWTGIVYPEGHENAGQDVPCERETKIALFENVEVANYLIKAASELGVEKEEEETENLKK